jgi:HAD superfamily hydrolase (TIGR01450 family)
MPFKLPIRLNKEHSIKLIAEVENFLFDCDGVIWHWPEAIAGSVEFINKLKQLNKRCFFITNNSTKTRETYVNMLQKLGINNVSESEIVCTSWILARYLKGRNFSAKCYVVGSPAIGSELDQVGIRHTGIGSTAQAIPDPGAYDYQAKTTLDGEVKCVVAGFDSYFNYPKMVQAASYAFDNPDCLFVATNDDAQFPSNNKDNPHRVVIPGTGI